jgi:hypothetical protein
MASVPHDVDPSTFEAASMMTCFCFDNHCFAHIKVAHTVSWVRMQSVIVAAILQCDPVTIAGSWRTPSDNKCTKAVMDLVAFIPEVDAGTKTGLTSRVEEIKVCDGTVISPYHVRGQSNAEHVQI